MMLVIIGIVTSFMVIVALFKLRDYVIRLALDEITVDDYKEVVTMMCQRPRLSATVAKYMADGKISSEELSQIRKVSHVE